MDASERDLLIEIHTKLVAMERAWEKVANGVGFPRCVVRGEILKQLNTDLDKTQALQKDHGIENTKAFRKIYKVMIILSVIMGGHLLAMDWEPLLKMAKWFL